MNVVMTARRPPRRGAGDSRARAVHRASELDVMIDLGAAGIEEIMAAQNDAVAAERVA